MPEVREIKSKEPEMPGGGWGEIMGEVGTFQKRIFMFVPFFF